MTSPWFRFIQNTIQLINNNLHYNGWIYQCIIEQLKKMNERNIEPIHKYNFMKNHTFGCMD